MFLFLLPLLFDFQCLNASYPDQASMCQAMVMQDAVIARINSENLELLGKIAQLERFALSTLEKVDPTPTPLPVNHQ